METAGVFIRLHRLWPVICVMLPGFNSTSLWKKKTDSALFVLSMMAFEAVQQDNLNRWGVWDKLRAGVSGFVLLFFLTDLRICRGFTRAKQAETSPSATELPGAWNPYHWSNFCRLRPGLLEGLKRWKYYLRRVVTVSWGRHQCLLMESVWCVEVT